jgi:signal transduction histidine kinase
MDRLTREFNAMAQQIEKNDEERRAFLADVSHELRTPLTAIKGSAETLRDGAWQNPAVAPRFAATIVTQCDRLIRLVGDLLKLARLEKHAHEISFGEELDAAGLLQRSADAVAPLFTENDVQLKIQCDIATLHGNADLLEQLLINLLANAARHSPVGSTTTLSAGGGDHTVLAVEDKGRGIAPEHLSKLGQRFYRVEGGRDRGSGGSGLGLAICRRIAMAHGGDLIITSSPGQGTRVEVRLHS